jgi:eukaryotic-like serine/threonine-protein kinase
VTGSSDIYSLGVVAYECLAGQPPFIAEQPLAIAIMHKHDPVPPLPADVPRPVADLVYAMLAKDPEDRPDSARHVADRAQVIMDARTMRTSGPITADLPIVPDFPMADQTVFDYPERARGFPLGNRRLAAAGVGVALCGVAAVVVVLLTSSGGHGSANTGATVPASHSASQLSSPATASLSPSTAGSASTGTSLGTVTQTTPAQSASSTPSQRQSSTPTHTASPTTTAPTTSTSASTSVTPTDTTTTGGGLGGLVNGGSGGAGG